jgi:FkbM family methyltransferase
MPFVDGTRLLVLRGMTGATGNVYCGLHEFEDMAFVLHALRPGDLFVDVGANVGSYTILAAGVSGANCLALEPLPTTFSRLVDNIRLNNLESLVDSMNIGVGAAAGNLQFTTSLDTVNHVVASSEVTTHFITVPVEPLDYILRDRTPTFVKIDVEGFETEVVRGAIHVMQSSSLLAVIMELNGCGARYGFDESRIRNQMRDWGFIPATYDPFTRILCELGNRTVQSANTIFVRNPEHVRERLRSAPHRRVLGQSI